MRLLEPLGVTLDDEDGDMRVVISDEDRLAAAEIAQSAGVGPGESTVALCPATTRANKHWTADGWSRLADMIWR
jgi:ADP-heptose:LPS heptosyltransferase